MARKRYRKWAAAKPTNKQKRKLRKLERAGRNLPVLKGEL